MKEQFIGNYVKKITKEDIVLFAKKNNIELDEIYNLIEVTKEELKNNNLKYKNLKENFYKILNEFPKSYSNF